MAARSPDVQLKRSLPPLHGVRKWVTTSAVQSASRARQAKESEGRRPPRPRAEERKHARGPSSGPDAARAVLWSKSWHGSGCASCRHAPRHRRRDTLSASRAGQNCTFLSPRAALTDGRGRSQAQPDGNCFFHAMADQLGLLEAGAHAVVREKVCAYIAAHKDDYVAFVEDDEDFDSYVNRMRRVRRRWTRGADRLAARRPLAPGSVWQSAAHERMPSPCTRRRSVRFCGCRPRTGSLVTRLCGVAMQNATWAGNLEVQAASMCYQRNICIWQQGQPVWRIINHKPVASFPCAHLRCRAGFSALLPSPALHSLRCASSPLLRCACCAALRTCALAASRLVALRSTYALPSLL